MSWVKLDDRFDENRKQVRMSNPAFRIYVCALTYCARQREVTGYMTYEEADKLRRGLRQPAKAIEELVSLNAWEQTNGGYLIHDYEEYIEKGSRERTRQWRERKRLGDVTVASLARDGYPVPEPVPVPYPNPPQPPLDGDVTYSRPQAASGDITWGGGDKVADEGRPDNGLSRIDRASLGTLLDQARANREQATRMAEASEA